MRFDKKYVVSLSLLRYEQLEIGLVQKCAIDEKNLQFSSNQADIQPKLPIHKLVILVKYQIDWRKAINFFLVLYF